MDLIPVDLDPTLVPEFYEVEVGRYEERIVIGAVTAGFVTGNEAITKLEYHLEPCDIPRMETRMRWIKGWS